MNHLLRKLCAPALLFLCAHVSQAQYADGTGTGLHQNQIFWLEWGGPALTSTPAGFTSTHIVEGTYIWDLEPGLVRVVAQLDNIENPVAPVSGALTLRPYNSGTWKGNGTTELGDGLQVMYPGTNPVGIATQLTGGSNAPYAGGVVEFDINLKLQMLINGVWTDLNYPGMVIADAESMASNAQGTEYISAETNGTTGWQILDVRNDAATIGQDPTDYKLDIGNGGAYFKLYNNRVNDMGVQAVMYAQGTTTLTNVQMRGRGVTALALGFVAPFDYGDAPASYGDVPHYIDNLTLNGTPLTADGTYSVTDQTIASLVVPTANVYINQLPDADGGLSHFSPNADIDGATTVPNYDASGTYTLTVPITNNTGLPSNLGAWIDWNENGVFDASEGVLQTNPASATSATFTWTGLTTTPSPSANYYVRVRVTTDPLTSPVSGATDGEVEDYLLKATPLPVTLISFNAVKEGRISVLNWETTAETNSDYFLVQRSANGKNWVNLGSVSALGESSVLAKYHFNDIAPLEGANLYRLKMVDKDESFAYSRIRELSYAGGVRVTVYPNPVSGTLYISEAAAGTLKETALFNVKGQQVYRSNGAGSQQIDVQSLTPGMYIVKATQANGTVSSHKVLISH